MIAVFILLSTALLLVLDLCGLVKPAVEQFKRTGFAKGFVQAPVLSTLLLLANLAAATLVLYQQGNQVIPTGGSGGSIPNPAAPVMGYYFTNVCPTSNTGQCFFTPANTQEANACSYTSASATVNCFSQLVQISGSVNSNVATYTSPIAIPATWASSNSITVTGFSGSDTYLNVTCTLTAVTANSVSCALTHANGSSTTLGVLTNSNVGPFVSGDVGKRAFGYQTCTASVNLVANNNNNPLTTGTVLTILTFVNSTQITLSGNAASTVTQSGSYPFGGCFIWGNPDDTAAAALDAAIQSLTYCPRVFLGAAYYMFTVPHFYTNPLGCIGSPTTVSASTTAGNIVYSAGLEVEGRGSGTTLGFMTPGFPESGSCNHGLSGRACWVIPTEGRWADFQLTGGGNRTSYGIAGTIGGETSSTPALIEMDGPATLANFICSNFGERGIGGGTSNGTINGVAAYLWTQLTQVNITSCGTVDLATNVSSSLTAMRLWIENFGVDAMEIGILSDYFTQNVFQFSRYNLICYDCTIGVEGNVDQLTAPFTVVNNGQKVKWYRGGISTESFPAQTQNNIIGYYCASAGCEFDAQDAFFDLSAPATGTGYIALQCAAACTTVLENSIVKGTTGGFGYKDIAGSNLQLLGGNNTLGTLSLLGTIHHQETGTCTFSSSTTCVVTFATSFGASTPSFFVPPNIPATATTLTVSALNATGATITASASNSSSVNWQAVLQ